VQFFVKQPVLMRLKFLTAASHLVYANKSTCVTKLEFEGPGPRLNVCQHCVIEEVDVVR
jgi:hypothetical protein